MNTGVRGNITAGRNRGTRAHQGWLGQVLRPSPLTRALALALAAGSVVGAPQAYAAGGAGWFSAGGREGAAAQRSSQRAMPAVGTTQAAQQQKARLQLQRSIDNLNLAARGIAAQQASQDAARGAAGQAAGVPDGLAEGGLKVDTAAQTRGWRNALAPEQTMKDGRTQVTIAQTADKAILSWETFNVGRDTTVTFTQQADWAVLNRVNDPGARPSEIQGRIEGAGTVMVVNRNGIVFSGTSQVDVRNLVAAAATISDAQFDANGIYSAGNAASFLNAQGRLDVQAGARITTAAPRTSTEGGGYVLLLGQEVHQAGAIATPRGQTALAAGDSFVIRKGVGTDGNQASTTRGNEITPQFIGGSVAGKVGNTGLIVAREGDVTMAGRALHQGGVLLATTSVNARGTLHLDARDASGAIVLGPQTVTAVVVDGDSTATAVDSQRDGLGAPAVSLPGAEIVALSDRRDLSRIDIASGGTVDFQGESLTLATGGQIQVSAGQRALVRDGALLDVSGAIGVTVSMASNNLKISVQGNEQRDAPVNREGAALNSSDIWLDRRTLVLVPKGTNGYESDRWYTAGGLLEVSGYLGTASHGVGEWLAQGGTVRFSGNDVVTQAGSNINLSGGTLDVQAGQIRQSWLRGADGRLYEASRAPGDLLYSGLYRGYEIQSARWGAVATRRYHDPLMAPTLRMEAGYTVGRDAGTLVIATTQAVLEGDLTTEAFQGVRQTQAPQALLDGYQQSQLAVARRGALVVGGYAPLYEKATGTTHDALSAVARQVQFTEMAPRIAAALDLGTALAQDRAGRVVLDSEQLNTYALGALRVAASDLITVGGALRTDAGGNITLYAPRVEVDADLVAHGGAIRLGNALAQASLNRVDDTTSIAAPSGSVASVYVAAGARLDASGRWTNLAQDPAAASSLAWRNGGSIAVRGTGDITLEAGSLIDVTSGAALSVKGSPLGGRGGDVTLETLAGGTGSMTLAGSIQGHGVDGGGTLVIQAVNVQVGGAVADATQALHLEEGFFNKGFGDYRVIGQRGLAVADGARVDVTLPVYRHDAHSLATPTGARPADALSVWTPALFQEDPEKAVLAQRGGASLLLQAGTSQALAADLPAVQARVGQGAVITVDPGQSITVNSVGQLTVEGQLHAAGGRIVLDTVDLGLLQQSRAHGSAHTRSIWIGEQAVLDASARAVTALDRQGRRYGVVPRGGDILIGGEIDEALGAATAANNFIVLRPGSVLDASGASAVLDLPGRSAQPVGSDGGRISLASNNGLYLDGALRAQGGIGAAGGTLHLALELPQVRLRSGSAEFPLADAAVGQLRNVVIGAHQGDTTLSGGLDPDALDLALSYGHARLGVDRVEAGGFDTLAVLSGGRISLEAGTQLTLRQSLGLYGGLVLAEGAPANARASLDAAYVRLAGTTFTASQDPSVGRPEPATPLPTLAADARLGVRANLVDIRDGLVVSGFGETVLASEGDLRFLGGRNAVTGSVSTSLSSPGNVTLRAAQIYPATGVTASVQAGVRANDTYAPDSLLRIEGNGHAVPAMPYAVFGGLTLGAANIEQGGVVRAPLGKLIIGSANTSRMDFLPGSITSVSGNGIVMPYGGTVDGLNYLYDGQKVALTGIGGVDTRGQSLVVGMTLQGARVSVQPGAVVDLSGGGELLGAGFVSGRGGSTDARYHPLVQNSRDGSFHLPGLASNPVYAIVPGVQAPQAPAGGEGGAVDPVIGQQITLANAVPGLPAGTYTLMPSTYALLPGAFRVELNGAALQGIPAVAGSALRNGSWSVSAQLRMAQTGVGDTQFRQAILTPADVLRRYSQYDTTSYSQFIVNDALRMGVPRALAPADVRTLLIELSAGAGADAFRFEGIGRFGAAQGGYGGTVAAGVSDATAKLEIVAAGDAATPGFTGVTLDAGALNAMGASRLFLGGLQYTTYGQEGNIVSANSKARELTLRSGALLSAPEVFLMAASGNEFASRLVIETGARINTIGMGRAAYDSSAGYIYRGTTGSLVALSNGVLAMTPVPASTDLYGNRSLEIGVCGLGACAGQTELYSEGTIALTTPDRFVLDDAVRYGTRHLTLAVQGINVGDSAVLADAAARDALPTGLTLNQGVMDRLLRGDTRYGAPALETLSLNARNGINFFGTSSLDTIDPVTGASSLARLVLATPSIYGHGDADDVALLRTGHLVWTGAEQAPLAAMAGGAGTGAGTLTLDAARIEFGYGPTGQPTGTGKDDRLALGFAQVNLLASDRITANNQGSLAVYQTQGAYESGKGYAYAGGNLTLTTPLVTGAAGSVHRMVAGGDLVATAPVGASLAPSQDTALGAELGLTGRNVSLDTRFVLPSGKLTISATGDLVLGAGAQLDLAGRRIAFDDIAKHSWGGDLTLESTAGNVRQAMGSVIDLSAANHRAGTLKVLALGDGAGVVDLGGQILGSTSGHYTTGGTRVPYRAGQVDVRAQRLGQVGGATASSNAEFAALNERLNAGGVTGARSFQLKQGDLTIGDGVRANEVSVSVDQGSLTVTGTIDASGEQVGSIQLAAGRALTLAAGSLLDTHGTSLRVDSYGQIIDAPNRAIVVLTSREGPLTLAQGARVDLRHGTQAAGDGRDRGTLTLNAPRIGSAGRPADADAATYGDIAIDARGALDIRGARVIAVNAVQRYDDATLVSVPGASGRPYQLIDQAWLKTKHDQNTLFVNAALGRGSLMDGKLAGLNNATYADAFHLRPGLEIVSNATTNPGGDLVVSGDLDLSGYRYASINPNTPLTSVAGSGEVGALTLRAAGNLDIFGSINDGFAPPPVTQDDDGWLLLPGVNFTGGDTVIPRTGVTLADGTAFEAGATLNFDLTIKPRVFSAGSVIPVDSVLVSAMQVPIGTVFSADVHDAAGVLIHAAGSIAGAGLTLPATTRLGAGMQLSGSATLAAMRWPKGVALPPGARYVMQGDWSLPLGALLPAATDIRLPGGATSVALRPDGVGRLWALAAMLPEGSQSWSMQLVAGSDLSAADPRLLQPRAEAGSLRLADSHYGMFGKALPGKAGYGWTQEGLDLMGMPELSLGDLITDEFALEFIGYPTAAAFCVDYPGACAIKSAYTWTQAAIDELPDPRIVLGESISDALIAELTLGGYPDAAAFCADVPSYCASSAEIEYETLPGSTRFSVLRTGAADLDLRAAADIAMHSLYGVYTAGTSSATTQPGDPYNLPRAVGAQGTVLSDPDKGFEKFVDGDADSLARAWYPDAGGNLTLVAGGSLTGDLMEPITSTGSTRPNPADKGYANAETGNWLWRQGTGGTLGSGQDQATAWWINFGSYVTRGTTDTLAGFTGFGTLGGGNLRVDVGGDAGIVSRRGALLNNSMDNLRSQGLVLAVGSTGRVLPDGSLVLTGGGDLDLRIGGTLNPYALEPARSAAANSVRFGTVTNLRGDVQVQAGAIGIQTLGYATTRSSEREARAADPNTASRAGVQNGIIFSPGDARYDITTRSDLSVAGVVDAGRADVPNATPFSLGAREGSGRSWFTLWTPNTAINLFSAGGDLAPHSIGLGVSLTDFAHVYPSILSAVAASGNVYYGSAATMESTAATGAVVLAPSHNATLEFLAADSIYGGGASLSQSGADDSAMATPFHPAFSGTFTANGAAISNVSRSGAGVEFGLPLFALGANTVGAEAGLGGQPARFHALRGDLVGVSVGRIITFSSNDPTRAGQTWYEAARPVWMKAGRDIVGSGSPIGEGLTVLGGSARASYTDSGNLFVHNTPADVSLVSAGRDILYSGFNVGGPGTLELTAGRHIQMEDRAGISSLGPVVPGDRRPGASIAMLAGVGQQGADYAGLLRRYLDAANLAQAGQPLADQPGKVAKTYEAELLAWLSDSANGLGFSGGAADALPFFAALPAAQQRIFARQVYFAELRAGGREYNDTDGVRFGSYLRGREAIATLFPDTDAEGQALDYRGDITMFRGTKTYFNDQGTRITIVRSGYARTLFGGDIQMLTPGGRQVFGAEGEAPPADSGVLTQGNGDISLYSLGSILLGQSRIMTTFGGSILGWSATGDINAGRGAKTTLVYTPPKRVYDQWGNVTLSPDVPSTGAGIATLAPIPEVPAGDLDLIAPLGTIDAGEAGIRVSGNLNLAALQVANAANIVVQGESVGVPVVAMVNVGALTSASAAASQAGAAAQESTQRARAESRRNLPSIITVQVLGFGEEGSGRTAPEPAPRRERVSGVMPYDQDKPLQLVGNGQQFDPRQVARLTPAERNALQGD